MTEKFKIIGRYIKDLSGETPDIETYFFVKDRIAKGEIAIEYCPTKLMIADCLTKPVQGQLFIELRDLLLGYKQA